MLKDILYSKSSMLDDKIRRCHYIPYRVIPKQRYVRGKKYFNDYWNMCFKAIDVKYNRETGELEEVYGRADDGTYHLISTELDVRDYLVEKDENKLYKKDIVNTLRSYTGAEITYWFYIHNIDCFNRKYRDFWKFIDFTSAHRISDTTRYFVLGEPNERGEYRRCRIVKDPLYCRSFYDNRSRRK